MDRDQVYELRVAEALPEHWSDWFEGLEIYTQPTGPTVLRGPVPDQAALLGILNKIQALNLTLVSVAKLDSSAVAPHSPPLPLRP